MMNITEVRGKTNALQYLTVYTNFRSNYTGHHGGSASGFGMHMHPNFPRVDSGRR